MKKLQGNEEGVMFLIFLAIIMIPIFKGVSREAQDAYRHRNRIRNKKNKASRGSQRKQLLEALLKSANKHFHQTLSLKSDSQVSKAKRKSFQDFISKSCSEGPYALFYKVIRKKIP